MNRLERVINFSRALVKSKALTMLYIKTVKQGLCLRLADCPIWIIDSIPEDVFIMFQE
jgi:hypothetical protein